MKLEVQWTQLKLWNSIQFCYSQTITTNGAVLHLIVPKCYSSVWFYANTALWNSMRAVEFWNCFRSHLRSSLFLPRLRPQLPSLKLPPLSGSDIRLSFHQRVSVAQSWIFSVWKVSCEDTEIRSPQLGQLNIKCLQTGCPANLFWGHRGAALGHHNTHISNQRP